MAEHKDKEYFSNKIVNKMKELMKQEDNKKKTENKKKEGK